MDAVRFIKERRRMCDTYKGGCSGCPMDGKQCSALQGVDAEELVQVVEAWFAAHPRKTRQSVFLEQRPETEIDTFGYLAVCPKRISVDCRIRYGNCSNRVCSECHREFWEQEGGCLF